MFLYNDCSYFVFAENVEAPLLYSTSLQKYATDITYEIDEGPQRIELGENFTLDLPHDVRFISFSSQGLEKLSKKITFDPTRAESDPRSYLRRNDGRYSEIFLGLLSEKSEKLNSEILRSSTPLTRVSKGVAASVNNDLLSTSMIDTQILKNIQKNERARRHEKNLYQNAFYSISPAESNHESKNINISWLVKPTQTANTISWAVTYNIGENQYKHCLMNTLKLFKGHFFLFQSVVSLPYDPTEYAKITPKLLTLLERQREIIRQISESELTLGSLDANPLTEASKANTRNPSSIRLSELIANLTIPPHSKYSTIEKKMNQKRQADIVKGVLLFPILFPTMVTVNTLTIFVFMFSGGDNY